MPWHRTVKENHLREIFGTYGEVQSVEIEKDRRVGLPMGFAYVKFARAEDAEDAAAYMNGGQIDGMVVTVSFVLVSKKRRESPGNFIAIINFLLVS
jgi:RNA-binding protein with serine-rich domain 1